MLRTDKSTFGNRFLKRSMRFGKPRARTAIPNPTRKVPASPFKARRVILSADSDSSMNLPRMLQQHLAGRG